MRDFLGSVAALWGGIPATLKTIVLAAIGTVIGAWLASRSQAKRRVIDELKAVRSAIALCFAIANKAL